MRFHRFIPITLLGACLALAQEREPSPRPPQSNERQEIEKGRLSASETAFVQETLAGNRHEVEMARNAINQASDREVKAFAQKLVDDHMALIRELEQIARTHNVPAAASSSSAEQHSVLDSLKGDEYDKQFVRTMVANHEKGVAKFEAAERTTTNPELKMLISSAIPVLKSHLEMARALERN